MIKIIYDIIAMLHFSTKFIVIQLQFLDFVTFIVSNGKSCNSLKLMEMLKELRGHGSTLRV